MKLREDIHYPKCSRIGLTHKCFSNDSMVLCKGAECKICFVLHTIEDFKTTMELYVNDNKRRIYFGRVCEEDKLRILHGLRHQEDQLLFRYLGIMNCGIQVAEFRPLLRQLQKKVDLG